MEEAVSQNNYREFEQILDKTSTILYFKGLRKNPETITLFPELYAKFADTPGYPMYCLRLLAVELSKYPELEVHTGYIYSTTFLNTQGYH